MTNCSAGLDIQLKVLQTLPALLQNYSEEVKGASLFTVLQICSTLQASKTPSVSSTAAATLQQLVTSLYERLTIEDGKSCFQPQVQRQNPNMLQGKILEIPTIAEVPIETGQVSVRSVAHDAFRVCIIPNAEMIDQRRLIQA